MSADPYCLLGHSKSRAGWFRDLAVWSTTGTLPTRLTKCVSAEDIRFRMDSGHQVDAVVLDSLDPWVDHRLTEACAARNIPLIGIGTWQPDSPMSAVIDPGALTAKSLLEVLQQHCTQFSSAAVEDVVLPVEAPSGQGQLVAVVGTGNTGSSVIASATAQALAVQHSGVVLVDLKREGDLAMMHDAPDIVPNIEDLVEAAKRGRCSAETIGDLTFDVAARGYRLMLGMCKASHWNAMSEPAIAGALDHLRQSASHVVMDVDRDVEGHADCGSWDVEERHYLSRLGILGADVVVVVGLGGIKGLHALARLSHRLMALGVDARRVVTVVNRCGKNPLERLSITKTLAGLVAADLGAPLFLPEVKVDSAIHDVGVLPDRLGQPLAKAVSVLGVKPEANIRIEAEAVVPGSLGQRLSR